MKIPSNTATLFKKHLQKFVKVNDDEFERILGHFTLKKFKKHQHVISAGNRVQHTYWTVKGLLFSGYDGVDGKHHIIQFAIEDCWITDQDAFYNQTDAIFDVVCFEDSELLCLSFKDREKLCSEVPRMEQFFRKKGNDSFVKQQKRLLTHLTSDSQSRFELLLSEYPQLIQRVPKTALASYLGVSRETLSRLKK